MDKWAGVVYFPFRPSVREIPSRLGSVKSFSRGQGLLRKNVLAYFKMVHFPSFIMLEV